MRTQETDPIIIDHSCLKRRKDLNIQDQYFKNNVVKKEQTDDRVYTYEQVTSHVRLEKARKGKLYKRSTKPYFFFLEEVIKNERMVEKFPHPCSLVYSAFLLLKTLFRSAFSFNSFSRLSKSSLLFL